MRNIKVCPEEKLKSVENVLAGRCSLREEAAKHKVHHSTIDKWVHLYQLFGPDGLRNSQRNQRYSEEVKQEVVHAYLSGGHSMYSICKQYQLRSISQVQYWLARYREAEQQKK